DIAFHDPFIERIDEGGLQVDRVALDERAFDGVDCVALLTPHAAYDLEWVVARSPLLFDARNATRALRPANTVTL
ncbi:MAG: nucleotide sugar dehydrogenase, partial [Actinomycetota bacterium]|nr:nucleotide sugar dehydrogenase [Actinomycetota bacterium]